MAGRWRSELRAGACPSRTPSSAVPGPSSSSADRCHWSSEGPGRASGCCTLVFSLPFFFSFFFLFFFLLLLSLCFRRFFRPSLEEEEEDKEEEELEELEEEEEELDRGLLRALCLLLSVIQGEGEAGRSGEEEGNLRPLALACVSSSLRQRGEAPGRDQHSAEAPSGFQVVTG